MSDQQQADIQRQLNDLNRLIGGLAATISNHTETWQRQDTAASSGRERLYKRIESLATELRASAANLAARVAALEEKVKVIKPSVDAFNEEKLREEGAKRFGLWVWSGLLLAAGFIGYVVHEALEWYLHLPPLPPKH